MTIEATKQAIDSRLSELTGYIQAKQSECLDAHGVYFQALPTHTTLPENGQITPADNLSAKPSDQPFGWNDVGGYPLIDPVSSVKIDTYNGPLGMGFVVIISFKYDGITWLKAVNFGPEEFRSLDWYQE